MRSRPAAAAVALVAACSTPRTPPAPAPAATEAPAPPARVAWSLTWRGAPIGGAWERDAGPRFERREQVVVRRGDDLVVSDLTITIERDARGQAVAIGVTRWQDGPVLDGTAVLDASGGWRVEVEGEAPLSLPPAVPFELALRDAAGAREHHGAVILAGWGFAVAQLDLVPAPGGDHHVARLAIGGRRMEATVRYDDDGAIAAIAGGDGVVAHRAALDADLRPANPPEVVDGNAIAVEGGGRSVLALLDATAPRPPALPGQRVASATWEITLDASAPGELAPAAPGPDRTGTIAILVQRVADEVADDLGATAATAGAARSATHGDCTTHALRFAALAADADIDARVVTGLRLDGGALVRHRWNVAWTGSRWITVDPTWAEAPAAPMLVGLAVHGARAADLAAADATVFDGLGTRATIR